MHARDAKTAKAVKGEWIRRSPLRSVSQVYQGAPSNKKTLDDVGKIVSEETGAPYKAPGIKGQSRVFEKDGWVRKILAGRSPAGVTDIVRATFITETPAKADQVVEELGKHFPITDEGWKQTEQGYFDRAVNVRFHNGQIGEVLLMPQEMSDAKSPDIGGGHDLYVKWRALPKGNPEKERLGQEQNALYGAARAKLGPAWRQVIGRLAPAGPA